MAPLGRAGTSASHSLPYGVASSRASGPGSERGHFRIAIAAVRCRLVPDLRSRIRAGTPCHGEPRIETTQSDSANPSAPPPHPWLSGPAARVDQSSTVPIQGRAVPGQAFHVKHEAREIEAVKTRSPTPHSPPFPVTGHGGVRPLCVPDERRTSSMETFPHTLPARRRATTAAPQAGVRSGPPAADGGGPAGAEASPPCRRPLRDQAEAPNTAAMGIQHHGVIKRAPPNTGVPHLNRK